MERAKWEILVKFFRQVVKSGRKSALVGLKTLHMWDQYSRFADSVTGAENQQNDPFIDKDRQLYTPLRAITHH